MQSILEEEEEEREVAIADYRDYQFYSRVVEGMAQRQRQSKFVDLQYQNQVLIEHIAFTRSTTALPQNQQMRNSAIAHRDAFTLINGAIAVINGIAEEEDLIFELDI